jgi:hypothetical protein
MAEAEKKKSKWALFRETLPVLESPPFGYIPATKYARQVEMNAGNLSRRILEGAIHKRHLCVIPRESGGKPILYIDWNSTAYSFIIARGEKKFPAGFKRNKHREYLPIRAENEKPVAEKNNKKKETPEAEEQLPPDEMTQQLMSEGIMYEPVTDLASAKYRKEQLHIAKLQAELKQANNELIKIEDVKKHDTQTALLVKAALDKAINKLAPVVAQHNSVVKCKSLLKKEIANALKTLKPYVSAKLEKKIKNAKKKAATS